MTCHICKALRNLLEAPPKLRNLCRKYCRTCGTRQAPESAPGPARTAPRSLLWLKTMSFAAGEKPCFPAWLGVFALIFQQSSPPGCRYQLTPCCNALLLHIYVGFLLTKLCWLCLRAQVPHHVFLSPSNPFTAKYVSKNGIWEPVPGLQDKSIQIGSYLDICYLRLYFWFVSLALSLSPSGLRDSSQTHSCSGKTSDFEDLLESQD